MRWLDKHFTERFADARTSWGFVATLAGSIATWIVISRVFGVDQDLFYLNCALSVEASLSMPILYMAIELSAERDRARTRELLQTNREILARLVVVADAVEEIADADTP